MFNFFDELKKEYAVLPNQKAKYNVVFVGGCLVYIEGHLGIVSMREDNMTVRVKGGLVQISGEGLFLKDLTKNTVTVQGKILNIGVL